MMYSSFEITNILKDSGLPEFLGPETLAKVRAQYDAPSRSYHDFDHAIFVLDSINYVCLRYSEAQLAPYTHLELRLAALYHDAVYEKQGSPVNEKDSWDFFLEAVKEEEGRHTNFNLDNVQSLIMATAKHKDSNPTMFALAPSLLLDCDVLGLAAPRAEFLYNTKLLVEEFSEWYEQDVVLQGQKDFYSLMLKKSCVYMTPEFRDHYEINARANMQFAVDCDDLGALLK